MPSALKSNDRGRKDVNVPVSGLSKPLAGRRVTSVLLRVDAEKIEHSNNVISEDTFRKSDVEVGKYVPMAKNQSDKSGNYAIPEIGRKAFSKPISEHAKFNQFATNKP